MVQWFSKSDDQSSSVQCLKINVKPAELHLSSRSFQCVTIKKKEQHMHTFAKTW